VLNLDPSKLLIIAVVAVILLGPDKLPQVARQAGAAWRTFNEFRHRMESEVRSSIPDLPSSAEIARLARSPSALLNHLSSLSPDERGTEAATSADPSGVESHGQQSTTTSMPPSPMSPTSTSPTSTPAGAPTSPSAQGAAGAAPNSPPPAPGVFGDPSLN
jgi:sec-independent protein translocase protein TatB